MKLDIVASLLQDTYYKEFIKDGDFFKEEDFISFISIAYSAAMQEDFDQSIKKNKALNGVGSPELSDDWFSHEVFHVKHSDGEDFIENVGVFSFQNDSDNSGIKIILPENKNATCTTFTKTSIDRVSSLRFLPKSDKTIYYYPLRGNVYLKRKNCNVEKVIIVRIPAVSLEKADEINIPDTFVENIITRAMNLMKQDKDSPIIDKTNDQNPNKAIQTER